MNFFFIILTFLISAFIARILIPRILLISLRKKLFDIPDNRKIHKRAIPRLGGVSFFPTTLFSFCLVYAFRLLGGDSVSTVYASYLLPELLLFACGMTLLYLTGIADDLVGVRYRQKFVIQIFCACLFPLSGIWINDLYGLFGIHELSAYIGMPFTVLIIVFITNAINLIDGIDGLASGLCGVATLFYGLVFFIIGEYIYALLAFATLGVLVPFFYYNVFGDPAKKNKIFMGHTGSLTIGMMTCILSLKLLDGFPVNPSMQQPNAFFLAYSPLIIPCFDVVRVYLHRVRNGKNPFLPDKNHIHHKMLAVGMRQRTVMIAIVLVSVCFTLCNILLSRYINVTLLLILDIFIWTLGNLWLTRRIHIVHSKL